MRYSIRFRLILTLALLIISTIFLNWFTNWAFLKDYYEFNKRNTLVEAYSEVNQVYNNIMNEAEIEENAITLDRLGANKNMSIYIFDLFYNQFTMWPVYKYPSNLNDFQMKEMQSRIGSYVTNGYGADDLNYSINTVFDERINSNYLELFGELDDKSLIYIRTNYQSMQESVEISNQFLAYVGVFATILGIVIMFFISRSFTKPILQLSDIANKISNLDFETKYKVKGQDEISTLGNSINTLSEKLERTISELKSANNELQSDIENKIQIDEMRKDFLSNVSHELKTPIALIQGYAEGLYENINDDVESKEFYCEVIIDEANKMNKMVKKLISLNQIESGNNQIQLERFDIVSLLDSVIASSEILFRQNGVTLHLKKQDPIFVWADEYMVEEVIINYISNAINHVEGDKVIDIKLSIYDGLVRVSVFNTGENISDEDIDKIWVKFYKVDKARTREYGGSGIGLSIVKAIMNNLNRQYGVINHENGVEFWFELDIKKE